MGLLDGRNVTEVNVALVHDWLTGMRGGERVLEEFCRLFPEAPLYTLVHAPGRVSPLIEQRVLHTSFLQRIPGIARRYRYFLPLFPAAARGLHLQGYDLVLSSSHAAAKGVSIAPGTLHVCYLHAPLRYMWDSFDDYFGPGRARWPVRAAAHLLRPWLQRWDRASTTGVHRLLVNSRNIQAQVQRIYHRDATVVYPPVSVERFAPAQQREDFYLMVGAFAPNKRVDLAVQAFTRMNKPLRIVGGGQTEAACRRMAGPSITFLGERSDGEIADLYARARAFIFPGEDDFGITPVEAQASGTPVIAQAVGGALETVTPATGVLFHEASVDGLMRAVEDFEQRQAQFSPAACVANAARFAAPRFREELLRELEGAWRAHAEGSAP